jgi:hypothetical protein
LCGILRLRTGLIALALSRVRSLPDRLKLPPGSALGVEEVLALVSGRGLSPLCTRSLRIGSPLGRGLRFPGHPSAVMGCFRFCFSGRDARGQLLDPIAQPVPPGAFAISTGLRRSPIGLGGVRPCLGGAAIDIGCISPFFCAISPLFGLFGPLFGPFGTSL